jgi:hypothetical protein
MWSVKSAWEAEKCLQKFDGKALKEETSGKT